MIGLVVSGSLSNALARQVVGGVLLCLRTLERAFRRQ
jgi:hypothetical protein